MLFLKMKLLRFFFPLLLLSPVAANALPEGEGIASASEEVLLLEVIEHAVDHEDAFLPQPISYNSENYYLDFNPFCYRDQYFLNKAESYLLFSKSIVPGLQALELIFPFHSFF